MLTKNNGYRLFHDAVDSAMLLQGAIACAMVDLESGTCLARAGNDKLSCLESAGLVNARLLRTQMQMLEDQHHEEIEDVLITLGHQYHLIHLIHLTRSNADPTFIFVYMVLDRESANVVMARRKLKEIRCALIATPAMTQSVDEERFAMLRMPSGRGKLDEVDETWDDDELPPFMRDDVALKLLGINEDAEYVA